jgi:peptidoglycan/xylan/chitin deacetylase (PgdA/CDA1 family)
MGAPGFPILMFHALTEQRVSERYTLALDDFASMMNKLRSEGRRGVSLTQALQAKCDNTRDVAITFDDGHASNHDLALPVLLDLGFTATFFITTARIGSDDEWMTWRHLAALRESGMDLQAHGHTHRFLTELTRSDQDLELDRPRRLFEEKLGHTVEHLSFPGGRYTRYALRRAWQLGYRSACTSIPGINGQIDERRGLLLLRRYTMKQGISPAAFDGIVRCSSAYAARSVMSYRCKSLARAVLGERGYHALWKNVMRKGE